jgi:hypothetical protein
VTRLTEIRLGRNFVRVGDVVRVTPSRPRKRDGFTGKVVTIRGTDAGVATHVDVADPRHNLRTLDLGRIRRVAQTRVEARP